LAAFEAMLFIIVAMERTSFNLWSCVLIDGRISWGQHPQCYFRNTGLYLNTCSGNQSNVGSGSIFTVRLWCCMVIFQWMVQELC